MEVSGVLIEGGAAVTVIAVMTLVTVLAVVARHRRQHLIAKASDRGAHRVLKQIGIDGAVKVHGRAPGNEVHHGVVHAGQLREPSLNRRSAPGTGHAANGKIDCGGSGRVVLKYGHADRLNLTAHWNVKT